MKNVIFILLFFIVACSSEEKIDIEIMNLQKIQYVPYYNGLEAGGDKLFWDIANKYKKDPKVILDACMYREKTIFYPWYNYTYTVGYDGDIAVIMFAKIVKDVPIREFVEKSGYKTFAEMIKASPIENRIVLCKKHRDWFEKNKNDLVWVEDQTVYRNNMKNPLGGCYRLKSLNIDKFNNRCL